MTNVNATIRGLLTYAVVLPLALYVGYLVANSGEAGRYQYWWQAALILFILALPLMLKWHFPLLLLSWNATAVVFFLPGRPQLWLVMAFISLGFFLVQRTLLQQMRFIRAPSIVAPVIFLLLVIYLTARFSGSGFGLSSFGSQIVGGKAYFWLFGGALGFFAMLGYRVPLHKSLFFASLFILGGLSNFVGSMLPYVPSKFWYIFMIFPVDALIPDRDVAAPDIAPRFFGLTLAAMSFFFFLLARHGIRGVFERGRFMRVMALVFALALATGGGFRSYFILMALTFLLLFYFEGLVRSKYTVILGTLATLALVLMVPFANRLPLSIQRSISFLPVEVNPDVRLDAQRSTEWRVQMWEELWPEVSKHLLKGKGLGFSSAELEMTAEMQHRGMRGPQEVSELTGSYHNGPLTVLIPFGIWGAIGWLWFVWASLRALYLNYLHGEESLKKINTFLLAYFLARTIFFLGVFGDFRSDFQTFLGIIGLSLSLNWGIRKRVAQPVAKPLVFAGVQPRQFRPTPALPRESLAKSS